MMINRGIENNFNWDIVVCKTVECCSIKYYLSNAKYISEIVRLTELSSEFQ